MSIYSDKIREMVDGYPDQIDSLEKSLESLNAQTADLQQQHVALEKGALDVIAQDQLVDVLLPAKTTSPSDAYIYTFGNFGSYGSSGNATDWEVYQLVVKEPTSTFTQDSPSGFVIAGNYTGQISPGDKIFITNGGTFAGPATVTYVALNEPLKPLGTYIVINNFIVQASVDGMWKLVYEYLGVGWDSDPAIQQEIDDYAFIIDHLHKALGTGGTYGIIALTDALTVGKNIVAANLNKIEGAETKYDRFGT